MGIPKVGGGKAITIQVRGWTGQILNNRKILFEEDKDGNDYFTIHDDLNSARKYASKEIEDRFVRILIYDECGRLVESHENPNPKIPGTINLLKQYLRHVFIRKWGS